MRRGVKSTWSQSCLAGEEGGRKYMESELSGRRGGGRKYMESELAGRGLRWSGAAHGRPNSDERRSALPSLAPRLARHCHCRAADCGRHSGPVAVSGVPVCSWPGPDAGVSRRCCDL